MSEEVPSKRCYKCDETKPATSKYFHKDRSRSDGLHTYCKACVRLYRSENRDKRQEQSRQWRKENSEQVSEYNRQWRIENKERNTSRMRHWRAKNKEQVSEYNRLYGQENKERISKNRSKWAKENTEKTRAQNQRRKARKLAAPGNHTADDIKRQYKNQRGKCYYCGCKVKNDYHVDHVIPLSRGGSNGPENIVISCSFCNTSKGNKMPHEWPQGGRLL